MPSPDDLKQLKELAENRKSHPAFEDDEQPTTAIDSSKHKGFHVNVNLHGSQQSKKSEPPPKAHVIKQIAESPWSKIAAALLLGAGGGETHRLLSPTGMVTRGELEQYKREVAKEIGHGDGKIDEVRRVGKEAADRCEGLRDADRRDAYAMGRYLYWVLPKTGVLITLPQGMSPPGPPIEFHPPPLFGSVSPNAAKPIQPTETFPLPSH